MPTIITRGAGSAQGLGYASSSAPVTYIEDVFSTYLYTGNGSTQTITNGIDLSGKGGLVWLKDRTSAWNNFLIDTVRGAGYVLVSNDTAAQPSIYSDFNSFTSTGFVLGSPNNTSGINSTNDKYASWTFREQPKFFDIVTYTGNGSTQNIAHSLGSVPGMIIVKRTTSAGGWWVYHRSLGATKYIALNDTAAAETASSVWNDTAPTSTVFTVGSFSEVNQNSQTFVAYLFAHDAGGFGLTGTDNVISCGSYVTTGGGSNTINLGWEPQWVLVKRATDILGDPDRDAWHITDSMRGMTAFDGAGSTSAAELRANASDAEVNLGDFVLNATGFTVGPGNWNGSTAATYIYIAIRRGPMQVPTSGTSVFSPFVGSDASTITTGFPVDMLFDNKRAGNSNNTVNASRLVGENALNTSSTAAETAGLTSATWFQNNTGYLPNALGTGIVAYAFRRAPGFFDVVCYTGNGSGTEVTHNLGVAPFLVIAKARSASSNWFMFTSNGSTNFSSISLNSTSSGYSEAGTPASYGFTPTTFGVSGLTSHSGGSAGVVGVTYVAYLFATLAGVSKVGSYTGTGTTQVINCGFTAGARFVMIKRTDSTGDWYVWDSARGIVAGNDPYLLLNDTAAEVTGTDYVDTAASGFEISSTAPAAINANGGSFIFLAIA